MAQESASLPSEEATILSQRKRKADEGLISGRSEVYINSHKQIWDKTLRVTKIPKGYDKQRLRQVIANKLDLEVGNEVKIHSLAFDAVDEQELQYKVATISLKFRPALLPETLKAKTLKDWDIDLPNGDNDEHGCQHIHIDEHFNVFTPLSPAEVQVTHTIDCIAIHGWGGHAFGSFRDPQSSYMWLRDSLPKHSSQLRLWIYGYESNLLDKDDIGDMYEAAEDFRQHLRILRQKTKANQAPMPIIFLVHSLGGLIFKEAMISMKDSNDPNDRLNFQSTYGAPFFGVPSQGMDVGALAAMIGDLPQRFTLNLLDQQLGHRLRSRHHDEFCKAFDYPDSKITYFFEKKRSPTVRQDSESNWSRCGPHVLLVSFDSATRGRPWETTNEYKISLKGDHSTMVKFSENDRSDYPKVCNVLKSYVNSAVPTIRSRMNNEKNQPTIRFKAANEMTREEKDCQQSLFFEDMNRRMNDISDPVDKTCEWLSKHPNYLEWFNRRHGLLWIKGKPGAGKSTLVRHVLATDERAGHAIVFASFFFHARGSVLQKSPLGLFRSLLHQILQQVPELLLRFSSIFQKRCETQGKIGEKWHWHERDLEDFFKIHVAGAAKTYKMRIYVDALDECGKAAASNLVGYFRRLMNEVAFTNASLSICFSCRHYPDVALGNGLEVCIEDENHDDIELYIQNTIENAVQDMETAEVIRDEVVRRSSGNFQWTVLVLPEVVDLCRNGYPLKTIKRHIQVIPSELEERYQELLKGILDEDLPHSLRLMQWICFALRPLSLEELRFVTIVDANTPYRSISDCQNAEECGYAKTDEQMKKRIRHLSRGLVEVKQHENIWIAQFIHQSVKDYLIQSGLQILDKHSSENAVGRAHFQLSRSCIRYIAMKEISNQTRPYGQNLKLDFPLLQYAITSWISHAKEVEKKNMSQEDLLVFFYPPASKLLQLWIHIYQGIHKYSSECPLLNTTLLHVASRYCLSSVVSAILNLDNVEADLKDEYDRTPLSWAAAHGHETVVRLLIERDDVEINSKDCNGQTSLSFAAECGHETIVKLLIERDDVEINSKDCNNPTPLHFAAEWGHETIVKLLIERDDVEINSKNYNSQTPLSRAAEQGYETIVKLLIERDDVEINSKDDNDRTSLSIAAEHGHETIVKLLIERDDVEMNSKDRYGQTSLSRTAANGHKTIVKLLIERDDVEINSKDHDGRTPLHWAARYEQKAVVKLLIERDDVEINLKDYNGQTSLSLAAEYEHETIVKMLIERDDVETDSKDRYDETPLSWAVEHGHETIVEMLIERDDVEINSKNCNGRTSLSLAAERGHETIVKMLIERDDVEMDSKDRYDETPLSWAATLGHEKIVKLLIERDDVDMNSKFFYNGRTPLSLAAERGHETIVKLLIERDDVEINSWDYGGRTPLYWAAAFEHKAVVKLLIERDDVEINSRDYGGRTPLFWAAERGHRTIVKLLIERDVETDLKDNDGRTPLYWAVVHGHETIVKLLIERDDVKINSRDYDGRTPLSRAAERGHETIVKMLIERDDVEINSEDYNGWTPLFWADQNGHKAVVKLLQLASEV